MIHHGLEVAKQRLLASIGGTRRHLFHLHLLYQVHHHLLQYKYFRCARTYSISVL
jgi:hypothetical protein